MPCVLLGGVPTLAGTQIILVLWELQELLHLHPFSASSLDLEIFFLTHVQL